MSDTLRMLDARRALDSTFNGPFGLLLCASLGLAATLIVQLFFDKLGFDDLQTVCVFISRRCGCGCCLPCRRYVLYQLLNCSVFLVLIVVMAWWDFKMEQKSVIVLSDIVAVLAAAASISSSSAAGHPGAAKLPIPSFFSLQPQLLERAHELMLKCGTDAPSLKQQQRHSYTFVAPLCSDIRALHLIPIDEGSDTSDEATAHDCASCTAHDVLTVASALLQRLSLLEAAKSSAHHTVFGIAVDSTLLLSTFSVMLSGIVSGLSTYAK
jgi:hypothetical protein